MPRIAQPPSGLSPPRTALWWLKEGGCRMGPEWEQAHVLCQSAEGTFEYDLVHALCHWIEADISNRDYWYRRVGRGWTRAETIAVEWERIQKHLAEA